MRASSLRVRGTAARAVSRRAFSARASLAPPTTNVRGDGIEITKVLPLLHKAGAISSADAACDVSQFAHGQSNPTYLLTLGEQRLVLRKQPPGKLLRGAHAIDREYAAMTALGEKTDVPVPKMRLFVEDAEVLGTPFFVCDYVSGRFFDDPLCTGAGSPQEVGALYGGFLCAIAKLHTADYKAAGLGAFGKEGGYVARQTKVWTAQYRAAETEPNEAFERLVAWLPQALPSDDDLTTLVHGDLRVDNCIFAADSPDVRSKPRTRMAPTLSCCACDGSGFCLSTPPPAHAAPVPSSLSLSPPTHTCVSHILVSPRHKGDSDARLGIIHPRPPRG